MPPLSEDGWGEVRKPLHDDQRKRLQRGRLEVGGASKGVKIKRGRIVTASFQMHPFPHPLSPLSQFRW